MVYLSPPDDFNPKFKIAVCRLLVGDKFLMLHRNDQKAHGDRWSLPGGTLEAHEEPLTAMQRELFEETGLKIPPENLDFFKSTYVRFPNVDFVMHLFNHTQPNLPDITLSTKEHKDSVWVSLDEALKLPLIQDGDITLKLYYI